jgi:aminoglycoside phosphotransferase (APT) family kinase protein
LHVPATYELVELNGRHGIVFERIYGISLQEQVQARPWTLFSAARQLAELHAYIHGNVAPKELPSQRHQLKRWIEVAEGVSPSQRQAAYDCIDSFPDANMLCHGDFHAGSIILGVRGPVIIDWMTAARGHPLADVARTSLLFQGPGLPRDMGVAIRLLFKISRKLLHKIYLKRYLQIHNGTHGEIDSWRLPQRIAMSAGRALRSRLSKPGFRTGK